MGQGCRAADGRRNEVVAVISAKRRYSYEREAIVSHRHLHNFSVERLLTVLTGLIPFDLVLDLEIPMGGSSRILCVGSDWLLAA